MRRGRVAGVLAVTAAAAVISWGAFHRGTETCRACSRPVHVHSRTLAVAGGRTMAFCCPACALSQHARVTQLNGFFGGQPLAPEEAYVVRGSDVNMCARTHEIPSFDKRAAELQYDRCSPAILAFGRRADAVQFARQHGGEAMTFRELAGQ